MSSKQVMAYLLGKLTEDERDRLEETFFADDALFEEMRIVETELIDAYVRNRLSDDVRGPFESRYLSTPGLRERVELARALAETANRAGAALAQEPKRRGAWAFSAGWWQKPAFVTVVAVAALLVVAIGVWWVAWPSRQPSSTQARSGAVEKPVKDGMATTKDGMATANEESRTQPKAAPEGGFALVLAAGMLRSDGTEPLLDIPAGSDAVRIRIDYGGEVFSTYGVALATPEGREVWSQSGLTAWRPGTASVAATVPTSVLARGSYILALSAGAAGRPFEVIAEYALRVERR